MELCDKSDKSNELDVWLAFLDSLDQVLINNDVLGATKLVHAKMKELKGDANGC